MLEKAAGKSNRFEKEFIAVDYTFLNAMVIDEEDQQEHQWYEKSRGLCVVRHEPRNQVMSLSSEFALASQETESRLMIAHSSFYIILATSSSLIDQACVVIQ